MEKKTYIIPQTAVHYINVENAIMQASDPNAPNRMTVPGENDDEGEDQYLAW